MSKSLTVWILQTGEPLHSDPGAPRPMRAMNLANALVAAGHKVVLWSSAFYHQEKRHRSRSAERISFSPQLEIRLVPSPGYQSNIGPGRLWDHAVLARNLAKLLKNEVSVPDVAFIGYPPIETAAVMTRWLLERAVPSMLDVKDQWPNIFLHALPKSLRILGRVAFSPYFYLARRAMKDATGLSAMTKSFLQWGVDFSRRPITSADRVVPLTTARGQVDVSKMEYARQWWDERGILADGRRRVFFVGSHSQAFDMEPVVHAARYFSTNGNACEFVICGDGPRSQEWRRQMACLSNVHFSGWVDRPQIEALAERSIASLAPYRSSDDFVMNVPNKIIDSFALGLPIISPLKGEVAKLISMHAVGLQYGLDITSSLEKSIEMLTPELRERLSANALRLYEADFSFETVYGGLVQHLEWLSQYYARVDV